MTAKPTGFLDYKTLRRVVGTLGVALPVIVAVWGFLLVGRLELQSSISDYYGLRTRDVLVGTLFTIAWFFYAYSPYKGDPDDVAGNWACVFALGVALFPSNGTGWDPVLHFASALGLFLVLSYFSLFLFTRSGATRTPEKETRNFIYRFCGVTILVCICSIGIYYWLLQGTSLAALKPVFWLEAAALWAFGIAWAVKGETIFQDPRPTPTAQT